MAELLTVPEVAAGATEVLLSDWLVQPGTTVRAGDPVAVVETDKAVVEIEAETAGVLLTILVEPGGTVAVGAPLALLAGADETGKDPAELLAQLGIPSAPAAVVSSAAPARPDTPVRPVTASTEVVAAPPVAAPEPVVAPNGRLFVSPIARRLLREAGLRAEDLTGTGPRGRIVRRDVQKALAQQAETPRVPVIAASDPGAPPAKASAGAGFVEEPHSRLRRAIATRLAESKRDVPHFYLKRTVRLDALLGLRAEINAQSPVRISVNDFVVRAVGVAYREVPEANVIWTDEALRRFDAADVGVAIASERGLVTPVVRSVETSTVSAISRQVKEFVEQANSGRLAQRDLDGGTVCVTNLGMYGVEEFAAIINPPQSAILAVGAARPSPVVVDDEGGRRLDVQTTLQLVLSVDHRALDGALAARWFDALVGVLESPLRLLF